MVVRKPEGLPAISGGSSNKAQVSSMHLRDIGCDDKHVSSCYADSP